MQHTKRKIVLTSPKGTVYNQNKAREFSKLDHLILIAGHYEGVDERILTQVDEEISFGDFVMTGGEIAATAVVDSVVRLIPGVLEKTEAVQEESFFEASVSELEKIVGDDEIFNKLKARGKKSVQLLEYPHYTRPEEFKGQAVPRVLLSGDHAEIRRWRLSKAWEQTKKLRPDLIC
ncbi:MAG: hypothetical protein ACE5DQ_02820, partial [Candidatus Paceibacterota bacterium]